MSKKTDEPLSKAPLSRKRIRIIVIISLVVLVVLMGVLFFIRAQQKANTASQQSDVPVSKVDTVSQDANVAANTSDGSIDKGLAVYDTAIKDNAGDAATVSDLYVKKSSMQLNAGLTSDAIISAQQAIQAQPSAVTYGTLGAAYAAAGNKPDAITAYTKAISYLTPSTGKSSDGPASASMRSEFNKKIIALGGTAQ